MNVVSPRVSLVAGALILLVGCYSNNGGFLDLDDGVGGLSPGGPGPDGGLSDGGGDGGAGGEGGDGGFGTGGGGGAGGTGAVAGSGGSGGAPLTGTWQPPEIIDSHDGFGVNPHVAIGANGEAHAVWVQSFLGEYRVWANRYTSQGGWGTDEQIGSTDGNVADLSKTSQPHIVVDSNGIATAAWADFTDPVVRGLVSRHYEAPDGWGDTGTIYAGASTAGDPRLSVDASGNVIAGFSTGTGAWANYLDPAIGWAAAEIIDNEPGSPSGVQVALEANGDGWAVWAQAPGGTTSRIFGSRLTPGTGWADAETVAGSMSASALAPALALDSNGNALFLWYQTAGLAFHVWSNTWNEAAGEFTAPVRLDDAVSANNPAVASDPQGNGTAVWLEAVQSGSFELRVVASRYNSDDGWSAPETLAEGGVTGSPRVAMDSEGNAVVVYARLVPPADQVDAWAHTYSGAEWSAAVELGPIERTGGAFQPSVAMDPSGKAVAVWRDGPNVWASTFE